MTTDPRTAILSDLCHPEWNPISESRGLSHDDAVNLVNAHEAATLRRAASSLRARRERLASAFADSDISGEGPDAVLEAWENAARDLDAQAEGIAPTA